jgi:hypothetical protein
LDGRVKPGHDDGLPAIARGVSHEAIHAVEVDCFASLAMTARWGDCTSPHLHGNPQYFFIIFVDGMFTILIVRPFTNTSHASSKIRTMSCV